MTALQLECKNINYAKDELANHCLSSDSKTGIISLYFPADDPGYIAGMFERLNNQTFIMVLETAQV